MASSVPDTGSVRLADGFESFSGQHFTILLLFALGAVAVVALGRAQRGGSSEETTRRLLACGVFLAAVPVQIYQLTPGDWDIDTSLPLALCDWAWIAALYALWTRSCWASALTYYWGLTLTIQGILTPSLGQTFPDPRFFGFWALHLLVVWSALYLTFGIGIRPDWASYRFTVAMTAFWAVAVYLFNVAADTNYGYLNDKPGSASLLDLLGPWPWYVFAEIAIVVAVWALMTWPWTRTRAIQPAPAP